MRTAASMEVPAPSGKGLDEGCFGGISPPPNVLLDGEEANNTYYLAVGSVKGYDPLEEVKLAAAKRWVDAVNADGTYGHWHYAIAKNVSDIPSIIEKCR